MKKVTFVLMGALMMLACNSGNSQSENASADKVEVAQAARQDISVEEAQRMLGDSEVTVLDVRTANEFAGGHIANAINIDVNAPGFKEKIAELSTSGKYVVYCHSGKRSARSADMMAKEGFTSVYNVLGGISQWKASGYDVEM